MGLLKSSPAKANAKAELRAAREHLEDVGAADRRKYPRGRIPETDDYLRANRRVLDAEKGVPWYQRG